MHKLSFFNFDLKNHFEKNKMQYLVLFLCFFIGVVIGIFIANSKSSYLGLLDIKDKDLIDIINGNISIMACFWDNFWSFCLPLLFVFLFSLNYYFSFLNLFLLGYQSVLLYLTCQATILSYEFLGVLKILLILPINICYFIIIIFWIVSCGERAKISFRTKRFFNGFDSSFYNKLIVSFLSVFVLSMLVGMVIPLLLKTAIFLVF